MTKIRVHSSIWKSLLAVLGLVVIVLFATTASTAADSGKVKRKNEIKLAPTAIKRVQTKPQQPVKNKASLPMSAMTISPALAKRHVTDPIDMKLLVISADGNETDLPAVKSFLDQIGIPYDTLIATQTPLTAAMLWDGGVHGYYQGIILVTGNLTYFNSATQQWESAFTQAQWNTLWQYEAMFGIRQVTSYTFPYGFPDNYGLNYVTYQDTTTTPIQATLTTAGQQIFPYLKATSPITIKNAWTYLATVISPTMTTPLLVTSQGYAIASINKYPDGRQNLTVTAANAPYLTHSMLLSYGVINWVTKGFFLGERHVNLDIQIDDILIDDDIWNTVAMTDTTGITYRNTPADITTAVNWRNQTRTNPNFSTMIWEWAFVGEGASGIYNPDTLTPAVIANAQYFNWVNHTYTHANLDAITYANALTELRQNQQMAVNTLKLANYFRDTMVQPDISGLYNSEFFRAAKDFGIKYMISDTSRQGWNNPTPNAGFYSNFQPSILIIPRRPTNLFYNLTTPAEWVSEYNCYYGPQGTCAGGQWRYWDHNLTYSEILDKESDMWLTYLLKWDLDPLMFHSPNVKAYDGTHSLLSDLTDAVLAKYNSMYNLPIRNMPEHQVGIRMAQRMAYNASGVRASLVPCTSITLTASKAALIPVTGVSTGTNRETYGGQTISYIQLNANQSVTFPAPACP